MNHFDLFLDTFGVFWGHGSSFGAKKWGDKFGRKKGSLLGADAAVFGGRGSSPEGYISFSRSLDPAISDIDHEVLTRQAARWGAAPDLQASPLPPTLGFRGFDVWMLAGFGSSVVWLAGWLPGSSQGNHLGPFPLELLIQLLGCVCVCVFVFPCLSQAQRTKASLLEKS